jgi:hypothetical protein
MLVKRSAQDPATAAAPVRHATVALVAAELLAECFHTGRRSDLLMGLLWQVVDLTLDAGPHAERRTRCGAARMTPAVVPGGTDTDASFRWAFGGHMASLAGRG